MRTLAVIALIVLPWTQAFGQDGLRSPVLPEGGPLGVPPLSRDLFTVAPDFYRLPPRPVPATPVGALSWFILPDSRKETEQPGRSRENGRAVRGESRPLERRLDRRSTSATMPAVMLSGGPPRTFYIIDGCYAGDTRPDRARLPERCRQNAVRVVPPSP